MNRKEIWKKVKDFEEYYLVSNKGRVRSLRRNIILSPRTTKKCYLSVNLYKEKTRYYFIVHRLVALNFLKRKNPKDEVNHINGNKKDNRVENLEWTSHSLNLIHAYKNKLKKIQRGTCASNWKLSEMDVIEISNQLMKGKKVTCIARLYKVNPTTISDINRGKTWSWLTGASKTNRINSTNCED